MKLFKCVRIFNKVFIGYNVYILRLIPKEQIVFDLGMKDIIITIILKGFMKNSVGI